MHVSSNSYLRRSFQSSVSWLSLSLVLAFACAGLQPVCERPAGIRSKIRLALLGVP